MRWSIAFVTLLGLLVGGCKKTLHWQVIEDQIEERVLPKLPKGMTAKVTCPETAVEVGLVFTCLLEASDHSSAKIQVTLKDYAGNYEMKEVR